MWEFSNFFTGLLESRSPTRVDVVANPRQNAMVFDRFRLDPDTESVWCETDEIRLRPKAFAVLRYLAEHPHRLVTKDELLEAVWADVTVGETALAGLATLALAEGHPLPAARLLGAKDEAIA